MCSSDLVSLKHNINGGVTSFFKYQIHSFLQNEKALGETLILSDVGGLVKQPAESRLGLASLKAPPSALEIIISVKDVWSQVFARNRTLGVLLYRLG